MVGPDGWRCGDERSGCPRDRPGGVPEEAGGKERAPRDSSRGGHGMGARLDVGALLADAMKSVRENTERANKKRPSSTEVSHDGGSAPRPPLKAAHDGGSAPRPPLKAAHDGGSAPR